MTNINSQEIAKINKCENCNYICYKQSDYKKHLLTAKHKRLTTTNKNSPEIARAYNCECGNVYMHLSSLCKHKKKCNQVNATIIEDKEREPTDNSIILDLISQNKELMEMLQEQNKIIQDLVPKIGNTNNNNTSNSNNQFNLQVFLNEDCKDALNFSEFLAQIQVSFEDLENQAENGYIKGISRLFIESLQELGQNKRPIHCSDKKRKTIYIKENDEWDKEGSLDILKKGINEVTKRTLQTLMKEKENNAEEYKDMDSEFSMKCLDIQRNLFPTVDRDATIGKVIEKITQSSGIVDKVL
jgi:hypothetical protein